MASAAPSSICATNRGRGSSPRSSSMHCAMPWAAALCAAASGRAPASAFSPENRLEFVASYFGIMRMGAVAVPVNHKLPRATIAHIFRDSAHRTRPERRGAPAVRAGYGADGRFRRRGCRRIRCLPGSRARSKPSCPTRTRWRRFSTPRDRRACRRACRSPTAASSGRPCATSNRYRPEATGGSTLVVAPLYHMNGLFNHHRRAREPHAGDIAAALRCAPLPRDRGPATVALSCPGSRPCMR